MSQDNMVVREICGHAVRITTDAGTVSVDSDDLISLLAAVCAGEWTEDGSDEQTEGGRAADLMYDGMRLMARLLGVTVR